MAKEGGHIGQSPYGKVNFSQMVEFWRLKQRGTIYQGVGRVKGTNK